MTEHNRVRAATTNPTDNTEEQVDIGLLLELAVGLARKAGAVIVDIRDSAIGTATTKSSPTDPVTVADAAAEEIVVDGILKERPDDSIIGEEGTERSGSSTVHWLVDPIDGTVNYLYGIPAYSVSVAAAIDDVTVVGVVYNPVSDELFTAAAGQGAFLNGVPISVTDKTDLATSLVATGFSYDSSRRAVQAQLLTSILPKIADLRRFGSAALDLCAVAVGRIDGYYEMGLNAWDYAAGKFIVETAGGRCHVGTKTIDGAELLVAGSPFTTDALTSAVVTADHSRRV